MKQLLKQLSSGVAYLGRLIVPVIVTMIMTTSILITPAYATGVYQIPDLTADTWVLDEGDILSRYNEGKLSSSFQDLAEKTGNEVRIVTIRRLDYGETPESFAQGLFEKWFPSPEQQTNQVLFVIDIVTNGATILSGDEAKTILTDEIAESVTEGTLGAALRNGNKYNQGLLDVRDRLVTVLSGQPDPGPPQEQSTIQVEGTFSTAEDTDKNKDNSIAWVIGLLIAATIIPMATYYIYQINQPANDQSSNES
ncbi:MAG: YgcG family protein [Sphaerospermopsis sp. SIO1G1]|nr:YgcG family protein [Sphaerospermopsis sp. SIO1G1]